MSIGDDTSNIYTKNQIKVALGKNKEKIVNLILTTLIENKEERQRSFFLKEENDSKIYQSVSGIIGNILCRMFPNNFRYSVNKTYEDQKNNSKLYYFLFIYKNETGKIIQEHYITSLPSEIISSFFTNFIIKYIYALEENVKATIDFFIESNQKNTQIWRTDEETNVKIRLLFLFLRNNYSENVNSQNNLSLSQIGSILKETSKYISLSP